VPACAHHRYNGPERHEVALLCGDQWVFFEERNDPLNKVWSSLDRVPQKRFSVVVSPSVLDDSTTPEMLLQRFQCVSRRGSLRD
jgi:hypothetical protein